MAPSRLQIAKRNIFTAFDNLGNKIFRLSDIRLLLARNRGIWNLAQATTARDFIGFLTDKGHLKAWRFEFPFRPETRFTWGEVSPFKVIASLKPDAYFSHYTGIYYHGLTEQIPKTIYLNSEQPVKGAAPSRNSLEQGRIDRAFQGKPRHSTNVATIGDLSVCQISGKDTGKLGVVTAHAGDLEGLPITDLERTLIDATVRPFYAGGPFEVLKAYENARERLSSNRLAALLSKMDLIYPYHQAIGFYLETAGYSASAQEPFLEMGLQFDFYLSYQLSNPEHSKKWRLYFPRGLRALQSPKTNSK
jgi:predicted transcriptional regulator of viral defense system